MDENNKLLTPKQVAQLLQVSPSTIYLWAWNGEIPCLCLRKGKRKAVIRFRKSAIENWLRSREKLQKIA